MTMEHHKCSFVCLQTKLLDQVRVHQYRRYGDALWQQVVSADGRPTHAWAKVCSITDLVLATSQHACRPGCFIRKAEKYLRQCADIDRLEPKRGVFSFANDVYTVDAHEFDATIMSANYIDRPLVRGDDLPTPVFDRLATTSEMREWLYVFLGRLFYPVGQHDAWDAVPHFKGASLTLIRLLSGIFGIHQICVLPVASTPFAPSTPSDSLIWVCMNTRSKLALAASELRSMLERPDSNHRVPCATVPGVILGNFHGAQHDAQRGVVTIAVTNLSDSEDIQILAEIPALVQKVNRAYRRAARNHVAAFDNWC